jgi:hypothetical protein
MLGVRSFCLEFHLVYLILRETNPPPASEATGSDDNTQKALVDLSFLGLEPSSGSVSSHHIIQQANISIVICGWSNTRWTGYACANTGLGEVEEEEEDEDGCVQGLFAAEDGLHFSRDANAVEWDARRCWLRTVAIRCQLIYRMAVSHAHY